MGLPGCVGSMDVTHVQWGGCPSNLRHHCIGRYGYPTLGLNFICSHNRRIQYVSRAFYGATNDITITYNDNYPRRLMLCQVHTDRIFRTFNRQGDVTFWRGGYVITDGGYPTCYGFMNPIVPSYDYHSVVWGEWVESVRKDVERLFGALKNRFVWLKSNILYHKVSTITAAVRVCSILHNRLLEYDNMIDFDWENIDPNTPDEELYERYVNSTIPLPEPSLVEDPLLPVPSQPIPATAPMEEEEEPQLFSNSNHVILKASLIKHFSYGYTNGQIHWPKSFSKFQRKAMPILRTVLSRAEACLRARLFIQPSNLRRRNPLSGVYDMPIGESCIPEMVHLFGYTFWVYRMLFT
jgi:hypothetical protein